MARHLVFRFFWGVNHCAGRVGTLIASAIRMVIVHIIHLRCVRKSPGNRVADLDRLVHSGCGHNVLRPYQQLFLLLSGKTFRRYNICTYDICEPPVKDISGSAPFGGHQWGASVSGGTH